MFLHSNSIFKMAGIGMIFAFFATACSDPGKEAQVNVIPKPAVMNVSDGFFQVESSLIMSDGQSGKISYSVDDSFNPSNPESYKLTVGKNGIDLKANSEAGLFYGKQTLLQLWTLNGIPYVSIEDSPRFPYRGLHLDVSRHFSDKEFVLKFLDVMSYYKLNRFHWHLTDGGGWRIQIDKYPKLTSEAAFRDVHDFVEWGGKGRRFVSEGTPGAYGGYYTKEDVKEIVAYAQARHITIIPEIEMPGHSSEVFVAYPDLCCAGEPYKGGDFCIGNEATFTFLEDVLTEVMELFPSEYIHVGGDEASKRAWRTCPKCQARMKKEKLKDVDELQSYMIHRVEQFLNSKGRKLIGWDEILEGGVAPDATVMSWQNEMGGIRAARMKHDVVMTPQNYLYLDFYQADPPSQPHAIGGYTTPRWIYSFNPVQTDSLTREEQKHIIGVQANTWREYIPNDDHLEYMVFPRALALAEVAWTPQEKRDWQDFKPRLNAHIPVLQGKGINTFTLSNDIDISMKVDTIKKEIQVILDAEKYPAEVRYTLNGETPTASSPVFDGKPIIVKDSAHVMAAIFTDGQLQGKPSEKKIDYHRGMNKPIQYNNALFPGYMAGGMNALLDGYRGGLTYYDRRWQGYTTSLDCIIDMGEVTDLHKVSARFLQLTGPWVFQPGDVEILTSEDGVQFTSQGNVATTVPDTDRKLAFQEYVFYGNWKGRYVQVKANNVHPNGGFIFTDEIVIW